MKTLFAFLVTSVIATQAFALSNDVITKTCYSKGQQKVVEQARAFGCEINPENVKIQMVDNRWFNPSKYVWYVSSEQCNGRNVIKLVQYYRGQCF